MQKFIQFNKWHFSVPLPLSLSLPLLYTLYSRCPLLHSFCTGFFAIEIGNGNGKWTRRGALACNGQAGKGKSQFIDSTRAEAAWEGWKREGDVGRGCGVVGFDWCLANCRLASSWWARVALKSIKQQSAAYIQAPKDKCPRRCTREVKAVVVEGERIVTGRATAQ